MRLGEKIAQGKDVVKSQAVLPQDPSSVPTTYIGWLTATYNSRSRESNAEKEDFLVSKAPAHTCTHMHTKTHTHTEKSLKML